MGSAIFGTNITLVNCTSTENSADLFGSSILDNGAATVTNSILYGDSGVGEYYSLSTAGAASYSDIQGGFAGVGNINANPLLSPLADNGASTRTMALGDGSPCFGVGTPSSAPLVDQRGLTRPATPSMGAYDGIGAVHTFPAGLAMISAPADDSAFSLNQDFDASGVVFAVWTPASGSYAVSPVAPADTVRPGQGYWVRFVSPTILLDVGLHVEPTAAVNIPLTPGWNMVGCPRATAVPMSAVTVFDAGNVAHTFGDAASSGLVENTLFTYQAGDTAYEVVDGTTGTLNAYYGYWVFASQPCTLSLPATSYPYAGIFQGTWSSQTPGVGTTMTDAGTGTVSITPSGNVTGSFHSIVSGQNTTISSGTIAVNGLTNANLLTNAATGSALGSLSLASGATQLSGTLAQGNGTITVSYKAVPPPGSNGDLGPQAPAPGTYVGTWTSQTLSGGIFGSDHGTGTLVVAADSSVTGSFLSSVSGATATVSGGTVNAQGTASLSLLAGGATGSATGNLSENMMGTILSGALTEQYPAGNGSIKMRYIRQ